MEKILDNKKNKVIDLLKKGIKDGSKISTISAYFTIYAFNSLKKELKNIKEFRFLFVEPTFIQEKEEHREFYLKRLDREKRLSGTEFEIRLRNELNQHAIARECAHWIRDKVEFRSLVKPDKFSSRLIHVKDTEDSSFSIHGSVDFSSSGLGTTPSKRLEMSQYTDDKETTKEMLEFFDEVWDNPELSEDVTKEVLESIETIYHENSPEYLYFVTLYNIFHDYLEEMQDENIVREKTGFHDSLVWNKLYQFQKDGVMGSISKLEKYNGCILADSVGLGKTFEALAVIKYYELRNDRVLVLAPKKLRDNWSLYRMNDVRNILSDDRLRYDILNHTDLSRDRGLSGDINLETINWSNYDLVVIDESHNFRNSNVKTDGKKNRYAKLMDDILRSGVKTKVLMLSATPINNKMNDLKNQIAFITEGDNTALQKDGIPNIESTLRIAQQAFNEWQKVPHKERNLQELLSRLNIEYFKLLDALTIARSRKHIEKYYDIDEIGRFPTRLAPINKKSKVDLQDEFSSFEKVNNEIGKLKLSMYSPLKYVRPDKLKKYEDLYDIEVQDGNSRFKQSDREKVLVNLMRVNILKRLESSVFSYAITLERMLEKTKGMIEQLESFEAGSGSDTLSLLGEDEDESVDGDDDQLEDTMIGGKIQVSLSDVDIVKWKQDLQDDLNQFTSLHDEAKRTTPDRDAKLQVLKDTILQKVKNPINNGNKKVLLFSAFADTAGYLYKHLSPWIKSELGLETALVTGGGKNITTSKSVPAEFNSVLTHFSPRSKEKSKIYPDSSVEIDILIGTDCISEGQNLQDCDTVVNYDIHWNPVRIIQRFGRIDRIGSINESIQLVNFWPDMELDEYINLEQRVRGRMVMLNISANGEDDIINETDQGVMNDLEYRKNQMTQLQDQVLDLEDVSGGVSITDLTLNDFKMDLIEYMKEHKDVIEKSPQGMYAIADKRDIEDENVVPGVIFTLQQVSFSEVASNESNALHPYYMAYITNDGEVKIGYTQAKYVLDIYRKLAKGNSEILTELVGQFNDETNNASNMSRYSKLLQSAVENIVGDKHEEGIKDIFTLGKTAISEQSQIKGLDDFELISFLIIR